MAYAACSVSSFIALTVLHSSCLPCKKEQPGTAKQMVLLTHGLWQGLQSPKELGTLLLSDCCSDPDTCNDLTSIASCWPRWHLCKMLIRKAGRLRKQEVTFRGSARPPLGWLLSAVHT